MRINSIHSTYGVKYNAQLQRKALHTEPIFGNAKSAVVGEVSGKSKKRLSALFASVAGLFGTKSAESVKSEPVQTKPVEQRIDYCVLPYEKVRETVGNLTNLYNAGKKLKGTIAERNGVTIEEFNEYRKLSQRINNLIEKINRYKEQLKIKDGIKINVNNPKEIIEKIRSIVVQRGEGKYYSGKSGSNVKILHLASGETYKIPMNYNDALQTYSKGDYLEFLEHLKKSQDKQPRTYYYHVPDNDELIEANIHSNSKVYVLYLQRNDGPFYSANMNDNIIKCIEYIAGKENVAAVNHNDTFKNNIVLLKNGKQFTVTDSENIEELKFLYEMATK